MVSWPDQLLAAIPGFIDWAFIPSGTRAKKVGLQHMALMLLTVGLFAASLLLRAFVAPVASMPPLWMQVVGWIALPLALVGGWLGGELVERLGVGVYRDADVNAPSSLTTRPSP